MWHENHSKYVEHGCPMCLAQCAPVDVVVVVVVSVPVEALDGCPVALTQRSVTGSPAITWNTGSYSQVKNTSVKYHRNEHRRAWLRGDIRANMWIMLLYMVMTANYAFSLSNHKTIYDTRLLLMANKPPNLSQCDFLATSLDI